VSEVIAQVTIAVWLALEIVLLVRDRIHGKGSLARDKGTVWLNFLFIAVAVSVAGGLNGPLILLVLPAGTLIHRISVEEAVLTEVMGQTYEDYAARTKRLGPRLW
jgi:hypothetical protein